jgi:ADP-ribose pyrophosphatase YjhB (NUDIX family)
VTLAAPTDPDWLRWGRELQAIAQVGLAYSGESHFDAERYARIREIAAEMVAARGGVDAPVLLEALHRDVGYATPKIDVRGVVFRGGTILLVREIADGRWTLPGGWADVNQTPTEAVVREVREESGFETRPIKLLAVYDREKQGHTPPFPFHVYKLVIRCEIVGGTATPSPETSAVAFFGEDELPELSLSRVTPAEIRRAFEHSRNPGWPADVD